MKELKNSDIGKWFTYIGGGEKEVGKLKRYDNDKQVAFIVYKANGNWDSNHWEYYTAELTNYEDIEELK